MDKTTAARLAYRMNLADPTLTAAAFENTRTGRWFVRTLDGAIFRAPGEWTAPVCENPRYVPEKVEGYWRVRDTHNRTLMSDAYYDVMTAEDACLSLNRPQVSPTEPSDSQLRLLCDISAQREDDPELRMRASEVRWLAREARRAAQMDETVASLIRMLTAKSQTPPWVQTAATLRELTALPKRTSGVKAPELTDGLT